MEAIAAASSIVSLLGFVGQSVSGLDKLRKFFDGYKHAPKLVKKLQQDVTALEATLLEAQEVVQLFKNAHEGNGSEGLQTSTATLEMQVQLCSEDIDRWVKVTEDLNPETKTGFRTFFKRLKVALSGVEIFQAFAADVIKHRQSIGNSLAVLTVTLVQQGYVNLEDLSSKFDGLTEAHLKMNEVVSEEFAKWALQPDAKTLEESLASHFKEMEINIQDRLGGLSDEMSLDRLQREREVRSLCGSPRHFPTLINLPPPLSDPLTSPDMPGTPVSFDMASICNSLSSIAASLSGLSVSYRKGHHQPPSTLDAERADRIARLAGLERAAMQTRPAPQYEWACDALSGTDCAEVGGKCVYCGIAHFFEALDDSHLFGKHLVYDHSFGKCDLDSTFETWPELQDHLRQFHRADGSALGKLDSETAEKSFRRMKQQQRHHFYFHDVAESFPPEVTIREENAKLTDFILQAELVSLLTGAGILTDHGAVRPGIRSDLSRAIQTLGNMSSQTSDGAEGIFSLRHRVACLEEELILTGYDLAVAPRRCPDFVDIEQILSRERLELDATRKTKPDFSKIWMAVDPLLPVEVSSYVNHPFTPYYATLCEVCHDWVASQALAPHTTQSHNGPTSGAPNILLEEVPRGLKASSITMQPCRNIVQRISKWMQICFLESAVQRVLLRTSSSTRTFFRGDTAGWVVPVLEFLDRDGLPANNLAELAAADGAVDSRESVKRRLSMAGQRPAADECLSGALSFNSSRQVWIESVWRSQIGRSELV